MPSERLYELLAQAKSQPSGAYRTFESALGALKDTAQGYLQGRQIEDQIRKQRLQRQTLGEILGQSAPEGTAGIPLDQAEMLTGPVEAYASLLKAKREAQTKDARAQQANFLLGGRLMEYDPDKGYYPARIEGQSTTQSPLPEITPRVAPTIPTSESDKLADLSAMREALGVVKQNFSPEFVGPVNARVLSARQTTGMGATEKGALFTQSVQDIKDRLLRARSGAQINEQEYKRLVKLVPDQYQSIPDFTAKLGRFQQVLDAMTSAKRQELLRAGYRGASTLPNDRPAASPSFGQTNVPSFNTPEEAEASGHKGPAIINGKRAIIH